MVTPGGTLTTVMDRVQPGTQAAALAVETTRSAPITASLAEEMSDLILTGTDRAGLVPEGLGL